MLLFEVVGWGVRVDELMVIMDDADKSSDELWPADALADVVESATVGFDNLLLWLLDKDEEKFMLLLLKSARSDRDENILLPLLFINSEPRRLLVDVFVMVFIVVRELVDEFDDFAIDVMVVCLLDDEDEDDDDVDEAEDDKEDEFELSSSRRSNERGGVVYQSMFE